MHGCGAPLAALLDGEALGAGVGLLDGELVGLLDGESVGLLVGDSVALSRRTV